jgi:hypothetical protein
MEVALVLSIVSIVSVVSAGSYWVYKRVKKSDCMVQGKSFKIKFSIDHSKQPESKIETKDTIEVKKEDKQL